MNKLRTAAVLLFTVMLIAVMAMLPQAVARISDLVANEKPDSAPMQSVELAFDSDRTDDPGYMMRKLALEQRMTSIPIEPDQASMTAQEAIAAAQAGMDVYVEADMFDWFDVAYQMVEPYLGIDPNDKSNNTIFWGVAFTSETEPYHNLFVHIDDETGKILYINYETYGEDRFGYYDPEYQRLMMERFVDSFFGPLNLTQRNEYENPVGESVEERNLTGEVTCVRYTFEDAQYGMICVEFYITPAGFYVYFPSE